MLAKIIKRLKEDWELLIRLLKGQEPQEIRPPKIFFVPVDAGVDWFAWESEQIQKNGYAPWFDHWRYDGQEYPYPEPTDDEWRKVVQSSVENAARKYGQSAVDKMVTKGLWDADGMPEDPIERRRMVGQDPVKFAIMRSHELITATKR